MAEAASAPEQKTYSLEYLKNVPYEIMTQYLSQSGQPVYGPDNQKTDEINALRLYAADGNMNPIDRMVVENDQFPDIYMLSDDDLVRTANENNIQVNTMMTKSEITRQLFGLSS